jgi:hypothetical protein
MPPNAGHRFAQSRHAARLFMEQQYVFAIIYQKPRPVGEAAQAPHKYPGMVSCRSARTVPAITAGARVRNDPGYAAGISWMTAPSGPLSRPCVIPASPSAIVEEHVSCDLALTQL